LQQDFINSDLEILVSTMNRTTLDFLAAMFPFEHFSTFSITVINQTTPDKKLESSHPSVKVVNSFEKGLSNSRNTALQQATGKIILLTDDDVVYVKGFDTVVIRAFNNNKEAAAIQFCVEDMPGNVFKKYPEQSRDLSKAKILSTMSIELAYNRDIVLGGGIRFDTDFGLGARFPLGEEHIFLMDFKKAGYPLLFHNEVIVRHTPERNSDNISAKKKFETIGAIYARMFPKTFYFWILLLFFFYVKQNKIKLTQVTGYFKIATGGRAQYLNLIDENNSR
jgi:glycosyltransferase involved in cell wall biosynthesis